MKIQEVTSNVAITEKNEKRYVIQQGIQGTQGEKDKVTPDIDGFTNEPVVQRGVRVIKDIYVDGSK